MKIVIATPLFPPDIAEPAPYVKELARRLAKNNEVTVVLYGHLPEKVAGVTFVCVDKRVFLFVRLFQFLKALYRTTKDADVFYIENGASVELPTVLITCISHIPLVMHVGDKSADTRAHKSVILGYIQSLVRRRAKKIIDDSPHPRPELLPFGPPPDREFTEYNVTWNAFIEKLENVFAHARS